MENLKMFMNIGFVILCLAMLWYLFTYDPPRKVQAENPNFEEGFEYEGSNDTYTETTPAYADRSGTTYPSEDRYSDYNSGYSSGASRDYTTPSTTYRNTEPTYQYEERESTYQYEEPITTAEKKERTGIFGGLFGGGSNKPKERTTYERPAEPEFDQRETTTEYYKEDYQTDYRNNSYDTRRKPYDYNPYVNDDYNEPKPKKRRAKKQAAPASSRNNYSGVRYIEKRYSRDGQLGTYKGPMLNGKPHGFAVFRYDNGNMYVGEYRNGARNGYGNSIYKKDRRIQLRKYVNGNKTLAKNIHGITYGSIRFVNGPGKNGTYYGPVKNGKPHGYGYFKYENGDIYIGAYRDGQRDGAGNSIFSQSGYIETRRYKSGKRVD